MKTRNYLIMAILVLSLAGLKISSQDEPEKKKDILAGTIEGLIVNNLITSQLELVEGIEVVVSHVVIPPNTSLPKHWHPGEEFIYILEGSGVIWQEGKPDTNLKKGDVFNVPLKQIHTAITSEEGVTILVFRVHKEGEPIRINVE